MDLERPKRARKATDLQIPDLARAQRSAGWMAFPATQDDASNDGQESCAVTLYYRPKAAAGGLCTPVGGSTGKNHGHAEMDSLYNFLTDTLGGDLADFTLYDLWMDCTSKPCCRNCAAVLGLLNVGVMSPATKKSKSRMGTTEWDMPGVVKELLSRVTGQDVRLFSSWDGTTLRYLGT